MRSSEGPQPLSRLERAVIARILDRHGAGAGALGEQLAQAVARHRTHSGVGFMTRLAVAGAAPALPAGDEPRLGPVYARHPQLPEPAEFLLQIKAGRLSALEAYCFNGMWPADETLFSLVD